MPLNCWVKSGGKIWCTDEEGIIEPCIFAVCRSLELGSCLEVERRVAVGIFAVPDDAPITYMDIDAIISLDAVDCFEFSTIQCFVGQLVIGPTINNGSLNSWTLKGSSSNWNDNTLTMLGIPHLIGLAQGHLQL